MNFVLFGAVPIDSSTECAVPKPAFLTEVSFAHKVEIYACIIPSWRDSEFTLVTSSFYQMCGEFSKYPFVVIADKLPATPERKLCFVDYYGARMRRGLAISNGEPQGRCHGKDMGHILGRVNEAEIPHTKPLTLEDVWSGTRYRRPRLLAFNPHQNSANSESGIPFDAKHR